MYGTMMHDWNRSLWNGGDESNMIGVSNRFAKQLAENWFATRHDSTENITQTSAITDFIEAHNLTPILPASYQQPQPPGGGSGGGGDYALSGYPGGPYGRPPVEKWSEENWNSWNRVFKLVLLSFVSTIGTMGSIFIISAITVIDTFQVRGNSYLVSLAFGHLLVTILVLPASAIAIMADVANDANICHFQWIVTVACFVVTALSYLAMSADMHSVVTTSTAVRYRQCCSRCRVFSVIAIVWTAAMIVPGVQWAQQFGPEFCPDKRSFEVSLDYHPYLLASLVLITLLTVSFFVRSLFVHKAFRLQLESSTSSSAAANSADLVQTGGYLLQSNVFVYFVSLVMWLPLITTMVIDPINAIPQHYLDTVWYIALGNSCCYSYLYAATNRDFRDAFNKLFYYCCCKSHVTFTRKGAAMRRTIANESLGLRVHIIPGLNIYAQRKFDHTSGGGGGTYSGPYSGSSGFSGGFAGPAFGGPAFGHRSGGGAYFAGKSSSSSHGHRGFEL